MERERWQPRLVQADPRPLRQARAGAPRDVAISIMILVVCLLPLAGELARIGSWSPSSVGLGTAIAILVLRELVHEMLDAWRRG